MSGRRYPTNFNLEENNTINHLAVDSGGRIIVSPQSGLTATEVVVENAQVIDTDDGGTVTLTVEDGEITGAVYEAP